MIRLTILLAAVAAIAAPATAQTVRFQTSVGAFDLTLNPTNDPNLDSIVDNLIANVGAGNYDGVVINRAQPDFVLQLGSFLTDTRVLSELPAAGFVSTSGSAPDPVDISPADGMVDFPALSNTRGTVSLALSAAGPNSGSVSFFVNVADNSAVLDPQQFVPFAEVSDLTVVDSIFNLPQQDLSTQFGQAPGQLPFVNTPLDAGELVVIEAVQVLSDDPFTFLNPLRIAAGLEPLAIPAAAAFAPVSPAALAPALASPSAATSVPEPTALGLLACSLLAGVARRRR